MLTSREDPLTTPEVWLTWQDIGYAVEEGGGRVLGLRLGRARKGGRERTVLRGVSGGVGPGELVAVAGEYRAGKSLLLGIVAGLVEEGGGAVLGGRVLVNGGSPGRTNWRRLCGYVEERPEVELYGQLTVEEHLQFTADMVRHVGGGGGGAEARGAEARGAEDRGAEDVHQQTQTHTHTHAHTHTQHHNHTLPDLEALLMDLELSAVRGWPVARISAAEKKLLVIGQCMLARPRVMLIDEPTGELDASTTLELMQLLKRLAVQRRIGVVVAVRQMRQAVLPLFDRVLLLAGGATVFYGTLQDAPAYFRDALGIDLAVAGDHVLAAMLDAVNSRRRDARRGYLSHVHATWAGSLQRRATERTNEGTVPLPVDAGTGGGAALARPSAPPYARQRLPGPEMQRPPWLLEYWWQTRRLWLLLVRNYSYLYGQVLLALVLCLITSFSAFRVGDEEYHVRARMNILYFTCVFFQFFPFTTFIFIYNRDVRVLRRDRRIGLCRVAPLYCAEWTVVFTFRAVLVSVYAWAMYFLVGLRLPLNYTLVLWLTFLAEAWTAMAMGVLIVTLFPSLPVAETVASTWLLICIWFSGDFAFNPACTWILRWIAYLSPIFYAFNAVMNNEFAGQDFPAAHIIGSQLLQQLGFVNLGIWGSIGALLGFGAFYTLLGYALLVYETQPNRFYHKVKKSKAD